MKATEQSFASHPSFGKNKSPSKFWKTRMLLSVVTTIFCLWSVDDARAETAKTSGSSWSVEGSVNKTITLEHDYSDGTLLGVRAGGNSVYLTTTEDKGRRQYGGSLVPIQKTYLLEARKWPVDPNGKFYLATGAGYSQKWHTTSATNYINGTKINEDVHAKKKSEHIQLKFAAGSLPE